MTQKSHVSARSLPELFREHEGYWIWEDRESAFLGIIAIHNTNRGPALGGCRRWSYSAIGDAFFDVARLSRGMTYKAAMTNYYNGGLPLGGGKCVLVPTRRGNRLRKQQYRSMGKFINELGGRFISGEDVGTCVSDVIEMRKETAFVGGSMAGHPHDGDPSPYTALGVYWGIKGAAKYTYGSNDISGRSVYIEGIGKVGFSLMKLLHGDGVRLYVSNRGVSDDEKTALLRARDEFSAEIVSLDEYGIPVSFPTVDIYAPCALGGVVSSLRMLQYPASMKIIGGAANNVLLSPNTDGDELLLRGITYAPDYVINNRGLWDIFQQWVAQNDGAAYDEQLVIDGCRENEALIHEICVRASREHISPHRIADKMAEEIFQIKK